jgi:hypothetical protein
MERAYFNRRTFAIPSVLDTQKTTGMASGEASLYQMVFIAFWAALSEAWQEI